MTKLMKRAAIFITCILLLTLGVSGVEVIFRPKRDRNTCKHRNVKTIKHNKIYIK